MGAEADERGKGLKKKARLAGVTEMRTRSQRLGR
jgi:hypothetical protein